MKAMIANLSDWSKHESLVFNDMHFASVNLRDAIRPWGQDGVDFNTELTFHNCTIDAVCAECTVIGKKITFNKCRIGFLSCYATYFLGGLEIEDCHIEKESSFSAGGHNQNPHVFKISRSTFEDHVDFFDIWFLGPVRITDNHFKQGTNLGIYLKVPVGIAEGMPYDTHGNTGDLYKRKQDEPHIAR